MSDIVKRLRDWSKMTHVASYEAADTIMQLRATINEQSAAIERADRLLLACEQHLRDAKHEITKLCADLREAGIIR